MAEYADEPVVLPQGTTTPAADQAPASYAELAAALAPYRERLLSHPVYARLDGMSDLREVDATHTTITDDPQVQALTIAFLRDGRMPAS